MTLPIESLPKLFLPLQLPIFRTHQPSGCLRLCGGQISGIEAAVHATRSAFESDESEAALLVDAMNAFNSLNHQVALHNIRRVCPPVATILINAYRSPTELIVDGDVILSQEGTTQGRPPGHAHVWSGNHPTHQKAGWTIWKQIWYADDSVAIGTIEQLHVWWNRL